MIEGLSDDKLILFSFVHSFIHPFIHSSPTIHPFLSMDYIINIRFDLFCSSTLISFSLLSSHNWLRRALLASWHCSLGSIDDLTVTSDKEEPRFSAALYRRMDGSKHTAVIVVAAPWEGFLSATNSSGRRTWAIDDWTEMFAETSSDHSGMYAETSSIC